MQDPAKRAEWVYGQPMQPCPACGSYNMKPQMPIQLDATSTTTTTSSDMLLFMARWARATQAGVTALEGMCYYVCWDCKHRGPAVDCTGRTSEDCRQDPALNAQMKQLWNMHFLSHRELT